MTTVPQVVVLAPMPLELDAIVAAFGLAAGDGGWWTGTVGGAGVSAVHTGMGPAVTRQVLRQLFGEVDAGARRMDHVVTAGICGGLDPDLPVGTLLNPATVIDHASGARYEHRAPTDRPRAGCLVTTEAATLDHERSRRFLADGCLGVDMETAAVAEVCQARGCGWSAYRCIGDRWFDGLLDERVLALTNPDGSGNPDEISRLLGEDPALADNLARLAHDSTMAARIAAEAAVEGCTTLFP